MSAIEEQPDLDSIIKATSQDYANFFKLNVAKELIPVHHMIDEMLTRLEEFESLMKVLQKDGEDHITNSYNKIADYRDEISTVRQRIDLLQIFITKVSSDLTSLERQVDNAEIYFGIEDNKFKSILKPLLNKITKETVLNSNDINPNFLFTFDKSKLFKTDNYFPTD